MYALWSTMDFRRCMEYPFFQWRSLDSRV